MRLSQVIGLSLAGVSVLFLAGAVGGEEMNYAEFLATKAISDPSTVLATVPQLNPMLFEFQRDIITWRTRVSA